MLAGYLKDLFAFCLIQGKTFLFFCYNHQLLLFTKQNI